MLRSTFSLISLYTPCINCSYTSIAIFNLFFFFNDTATTEIYTLSLHDALPIYKATGLRVKGTGVGTYKSTPTGKGTMSVRSEEHTSELQSLRHLVCRLLLEKKKKTQK